MKTALSILSIVGVAILAAFVPDAAFAQEGSGGELTKLGLALGAGLGIGIAAGVAGLGQGRATAAALSGIARNPGASSKILTPMIIGLALIESLVIYALLIAFLLQGKI
ncbi:MAG TPA: ATP synthase F0 subunit C [Thermodesulfobacteriota bacterium]|jgi:F-type H+-transporting ATPase subunit c|nr:ATP synthase F0 subunit C [Thermodesulfobacteriota bacterium]